VLFEELSRLGPCVICLVERLANALPPLVDQVLHRPEGELPEHEECDPEAEQGPDHQTRGDLDERVCCERHG
jgi:hypothetical protein